VASLKHDPPFWNDKRFASPFKWETKRNPDKYYPIICPLLEVILIARNIEKP
jgi:hypothetical protein